MAHVMAHIMAHVMAGDEHRPTTHTPFGPTDTLSWPFCLCHGQPTSEAGHGEKPIASSDWLVSGAAGVGGGVRVPAGEGQGEPWLTAALPVESPYCSCKLARHSSQPQSLWRIPTAAVRGSASLWSQVPCSCNPCDESPPQLQANECGGRPLQPPSLWENPYRSRKLMNAPGPGAGVRRAARGLLARRRDRPRHADRALRAGAGSGTKEMMQPLSDPPAAPQRWWRHQRDGPTAA